MLLTHPFRWLVVVAVYSSCHLLNRSFFLFVDELLASFLCVVKGLHSKKMFSQMFGDPCDTSNEGNIYSALEFNPSGDLLASGDRGGRVTIYERSYDCPKKV